MKYLKLFEAFESDAISKMMSFLKTKINKNSQKYFLNKLLKIKDTLDIPIDKITDSNVKYLNRKKALEFKNQDSIDNPRGIYCLKFWFSIDEGYLGFTGTGNLVVDFDEWSKGRRRSSIGVNEPLSIDELNYVKNDLEIKKGTLTPVTNYDILQTGTQVIGLFSGDENDIYRLGKATIVRDGEHLFAIQNVADGSTPDNIPNWTQYGRNSWSLGRIFEPADDHSKLHIYEEDDKDLNIKGVGTKKEEVKKEENPLSFNLPMNSRFNLRQWDETDWSIDSYGKIDKADFAIVLVIDDILKSEIKPVSVTKKEREESKVGAISLKTDSEIRQENVERYLSQIVSKVINLDTTDIQDLQKIAIKNVCGKFAYISIFKDRPSLDYLSDISNYLFRAIKQESKEDKIYYLEQAKRKFQRLVSDSNNYLMNYEGSLKEIQKGSDELKEAFKIIERLNNKILTYLKSQKIETIEDLRMVYIKLESIFKISRHDEFEITGNLRNILNEFHYPEDMEYYVSNSEDDRRLQENIKKLQHMERYIDSILR